MREHFASLLGDLHSTMSGAPAALLQHVLDAYVHLYSAHIQPGAQWAARGGSLLTEQRPASAGPAGAPGLHVGSPSSWNVARLLGNERGVRRPSREGGLSRATSSLSDVPASGALSALLLPTQTEPQLHAHRAAHMPPSASVTSAPSRTVSQPGTPPGAPAAPPPLPSLQPQPLPPPVPMPSSARPSEPTSNSEAAEEAAEATADGDGEAGSAEDAKADSSKAAEAASTAAGSSTAEVAPTSAATSTAGSWRMSTSLSSPRTR